MNETPPRSRFPCSTDYRLCLLDTNAASEMANQPKVHGAFLSWSLNELPRYIPCLSLFSLLELRRSPAVYDRFLE